MKRITCYFTVGLVIALAIPGAAVAQDLWSVEARGGAAFATEKLAEADLGTGIGFEGNVSYRFMEHLAAYGGWSWLHFTTDGSSWGGEMDVEETGYLFGLKFVHPIGEGPLSYLVRAGGTVNHIEVEDDGGDIVADSKHGLGWEVGLGLVYDLNDSWQISPGVRYRALSRDLEAGNTTYSVDLNYISADVGISYSF